MLGYEVTDNRDGTADLSVAPHPDPPMRHYRFSESIFCLEACAYKSSANRRPVHSIRGSQGTYGIELKKFDTRLQA